MCLVSGFFRGAFKTTQKGFQVRTESIMMYFRGRLKDTADFNTTLLLPFYVCEDNLFYLLMGYSL